MYAYIYHNQRCFYIYTCSHLYKHSPAQTERCTDKYPVSDSAPAQTETHNQTQTQTYTHTYTRAHTHTKKFIQGVSIYILAHKFPYTLSPAETAYCLL